MNVDPYLIHLTRSTSVNYEYVSANRNVLLMYKNGSTSLRKWATDNNYPILKANTLPANEAVHVYWREPINRYYSGLATMIELNPSIAENFELLQTMPFYFFDNHIISQWESLVYVQACIDDELKFAIHDMSELYKLVGNIHTNKKSANPSTLIDNNRLSFLLNNDIIIYNHFVGKVATLTEMRDTILRY